MTTTKSFKNHRVHPTPSKISLLSQRLSIARKKGHPPRPTTTPTATSTTHHPRSNLERTVEVRSPLTRDRSGLH